MFVIDQTSCVWRISGARTCVLIDLYSLDNLVLRSWGAWIFAGGCFGCQEKIGRRETVCNRVFILVPTASNCDCPYLTDEDVHANSLYGAGHRIFSIDIRAVTLKSKQRPEPPGSGFRMHEPTNSEVLDIIVKAVSSLT